MSFAVFILIIKALGAAGAVLLVFLAGHKLGRWSRRHDYANGWDAAQAAERQRWEDVTGATYERLLAEVASDPPDVPGADGWPYLFKNLKAAGERRDPPPTEVLMAAAAAQGYTGPQPAVPSVAEVDELAARWRAAYEAEKDKPLKVLPGPPVVGNITDARPSVRPELLDAMRRALDPDETPTIAGVVLTGPRPPDRAGPDWLEHQLAAMDAETAAYLRRVEAEMALFRRGIAGVPGA